MSSRRRIRRLAAVTAALVLVASSAAAQDVPAFDAALVVLGVGGGINHIDLPDPQAPGTSFGTRPRVQFDIGLEARPWLEIGAELAYTFLPPVDSVQASTATETTVRTHLQVSLDARARWRHGAAAWAPFVRAGVGAASAYTDGPDVATSTPRDLAWNAGVGIDWFVQRHILLRAEGLYTAQMGDGDVHHHVAAALAIHYALHRRDFGP